MPRRMWKFLIGCVTIQIEGLCLEVFLNDICGKFKVRNIKRPGYTRVILTVSARNAEKIISAAERRRLRWSIVGKDRHIRFAQNAAKRWWVMLMLCLTGSVFLWLSGYCFSVEITGNETLSEFAVSELLEQNGIVTGMRKRQIDLLSVKNLLYREYPELAYAEARFDGTVLKLILQEGKGIPEILSTEPCTVVAEKRGVILSVTVGEGMANAEAGDIAEAGQPLILGAYRKKELDFLVHARGRILAQVDYFGTAELSLAEGLVPTGKTASARFLGMGRMKILLGGKNPYELYEEETRTVRILSENMPAYLKILETTYYECEKGISEEMRERAEIRLREQAYFSALKQIPEDAAITDFHSVITEQGGKLRATATVTVCEDIGKEIPAGPEDIENTEETGDT